ncbi:TPA: hypothetical protein VB844_001398 [Streptococcus suis]|nr:hypothetical protein [Streptococcus suis]
MYDKISPVYSIALVATQYFDDKQPINSFVLTAEENGQVLEIPFGEQGEMKREWERTQLVKKEFVFPPPHS